MSFHIKNCASLLLGLGFLGLGNPTEAQIKERGFFVFERKTEKGENQLEALRVDGTSHRVLRSKFSIVGDWDISRDGSKICFATSPSDFRVFASVREIRSWLFSMSFDGKPSVVLAPYGPKRDGDNFYDYTSPTWNFDGSRIIYSEGIPEDYSYVSWISIFNFGDKRKAWNSRDVEKEISYFVTLQDNNVYFHKQLYGAAMSPNGRYVICLAKSAARVGMDAELSEKDWKTYLVQFDLVQKKIEILSSFDLGKYWDINPKFSWHPDNIRFTFSMGVKGKTANTEIFLGNRKTKKIRQLTSNPAKDSNAVWVNYGRQIVWLSDRLTSAKSTNQIFMMDSNGSSQRQILKNLSGISNLRYVDKLADWSQHKDLDTTPLSK